MNETPLLQMGCLHCKKVVDVYSRLAPGGGMLVCSFCYKPFLEVFPYTVSNSSNCFGTVYAEE